MSYCTPILISLYSSPLLLHLSSSELKVGKYLVVSGARWHLLVLPAQWCLVGMPRSAQNPVVSTAQWFLEPDRDGWCLVVQCLMVPTAHCSVVHGGGLLVTGAWWCPLPTIQWYLSGACCPWCPLPGSQWCPPVSAGQGPPARVDGPWCPM